MTNSKLVYSSDDPCVLVRRCLEQHNQDIDQVIRVLSGGSCHRDAARRMAQELAHCFGISEVDFMKRWRAVFKNRLKRAREHP